MALPGVDVYRDAAENSWDDVSNNPLPKQQPGDFTVSIELLLSYLVNPLLPGLFSGGELNVANGQESLLQNGISVAAKPPVLDKQGSPTLRHCCGERRCEKRDCDSYSNGLPPSEADENGSSTDELS